MSDPLLPQRRRPARRRRNPYAALLLVALVPCLAFFGLYRWSSGVVSANRSAAPLADPNLLEGQAPPPALSTTLLSFRRTAPALSVELNSTQFAADIAPLADKINDLSCLDIRINGRQVPTAEVNPDVATIPASNQKLLTGAAALDVLGEDFVFETVVVGHDPVDGIINGDIYIIGGGDPVLAGDWYTSTSFDRYREFNTTSLDTLAERVAATGVTRITGSVFGDGSRYDDEYYAPGWADGVARTSGGPYDALMTNDARRESTGADKVDDPAGGAAQEFIVALEKQGVEVTGQAQVGTAPADLGTLASIESNPLPKIVQEMLTNSDNNTAEMLVKEIGYAASGSGTREAGLTAMKETIEGWGIDVTGMVLDDGSGLSPANRVTCRQIVGLLEHVGLDSPVGRGMAVAGESGTLAQTFQDTPLDGVLIGKTGTLCNPPADQDPPATKALSGYVPVDNDIITFAMVLNGPTMCEEYEPTWAELGSALAKYPAVASGAALGPR